MSYQRPTARKRSTGFRVLDDAMRLCALIRPLVAEIARKDRRLADEIARASRSVRGNIAEGRNRQGGHQRQFFGIAYGSANETKDWLLEAVDEGLLTDEPIDAAWDLADKICATLWKLEAR